MAERPGALAAAAGGRTIAAAGAGPTPEALRTAYLELLKLTLCDLVAGATTTVEGRAHGAVAARELTGEELSQRAEGRDWPLHGLTMTGLLRLDDLQRCVQQIVADGIEGDLLEAGTWRGGSSILMRATLDSLGAEDRTVWVADSFAGFPRAIPGEERAYERTVGPYFAAFDFLAVPVEEVQANFARLGYERGLRFVPGFFDDTLPGLTDRRWSLLRLDGDTYDATMLSLRCLYPGLSAGGYLVVDDYGALEECRAAVDEFRARHGIEDPIEQVDWTCARWRRTSDAGPEPLPVRGAAPGMPQPGARAPRATASRQRVPAEAELELADELAGVREQLAARDAEIAALRARLAEVTHSTSWRATAPLRRLMRAARR